MSDDGIEVLPDEISMALNGPDPKPTPVSHSKVPIPRPTAGGTLKDVADKLQTLASQIESVEQPISKQDLEDIRQELKVIREHQAAMFQWIIMIGGQLGIHQS